MLDCSVKKVLILFANFKGETTLIINFHNRVTAGFMLLDVLPALFRACVAELLIYEKTYVLKRLRY